MGSDSSPLFSGVVGVPFRAAGVLRHARAFHPTGRTVTGALDVVEPALGAVRPGPSVTVRLSKGVGLPGGVPDILGVAIRLSVADGAPWDLLLASSTRWTTRLPVPVPAATWSRTTFSSLTPFACDDALWWVRAETVTDSRTADLPDGPVHVVLSHARGGSPFRPFARVDTDTRTVADVDMDPVRNLPPGVTMAPRPLARVRAAAYDNSRAGRRISRGSGRP
ncbi:MAG: hypothetical protein INR72_03070 [Williamsia herbipolensis]|nr:hypothetical protein [Williamsia herbipolensis]